MEFGVCTSVDNAPAVKAAGWDYVEDSVQSLLQGLTPDADWQGLRRVQDAPLPVPTCNLLVPASLKITGPDASPPQLRAYLDTVLRRAAQCRIEILVFGSGGARQIPDGFDRNTARNQLLDFLRTAGELAARHNVTVVIEPLNRKECNVLNTVEECAGYVRQTGLPHVQCLVDSFHFWENAEPLDTLAAAMPHIHHVHVANRTTRTAPSMDGSDYQAFFRVLKQAGYNRRISVEAVDFDLSAGASRPLTFLKARWATAT
jgi:sugar phosphate isomerase/epimerase